MRVINNERVIPCDIDETLVIHDHAEDADHKYITVEDPLHPEKHITLAIHAPMVKIVKDELARGAFIIFWSRSGKDWANTIVTALNLNHTNSICCTKPSVYLDDKDVSEWLKDRVYVSPKTVYKKHIN